jgi:hypothetical protein
MIQEINSRSFIVHSGMFGQGTESREALLEPKTTLLVPGPGKKLRRQPQLLHLNFPMPALKI